VRTRLHSTGDAIGHFRHAAVVLERDARRPRRTGELTALTRTLTKFVRARLERIGQRVLQTARALTRRRSDVGEFLTRRAGNVARTIGDAGVRVTRRRVGAAAYAAARAA